jgi:hypothetical protein
VIPTKDKKILEKEGITGNFGPGTPLELIINHINSNIKKKKRLLRIEIKKLYKPTIIYSRIGKYLRNSNMFNPKKLYCN